MKEKFTVLIILIENRQWNSLAVFHSSLVWSEVKRFVTKVIHAIKTQTEWVHPWKVIRLHFLVVYAMQKTAVCYLVLWILNPCYLFFFFEAIFLVKRNFVSLRFVQMIRTSVPYFRDRLSFQPQFKCSIRYFFLLLERDTSTSLRWNHLNPLQRKKRILDLNFLFHSHRFPPAVIFFWFLFFGLSSCEFQVLFLLALTRWRADIIKQIKRTRIGALANRVAKENVRKRIIRIKKKSCRNRWKKKMSREWTEITRDNNELRIYFLEHELIDFRL